MGLDVYLYRHTDPATIDDAEGGERIEIASARHPQHMFKIGYFRSSYNEGGINRKLRDRIGCDLADIMGVGDQDYVVRPDWAASRDRAVKAIAALRAHVAAHGAFEVMEVTPVDTHITSRADALSAFQKQRETWAGRPTDYCAYSNRDGYFDREGVKVHAVIPGSRRSFFGGTSACAYVVYEHIDKDETEPLGWYMQALEIVAETCEWVLAQPNPADFVLHWSS